VGRPGADRTRQLAMVDTAHEARDDEHPRARLPADERHLALAVDRDDRVRDGPQSIDGRGERRPFEPVRQLPRHDVAGPDAETGEGDRDPLRARGQRAVRVRASAVAEALDHVDAIGRPPGTVREHRRERRLRPLARCFVAGAARIGRAGRLHRSPRTAVEGRRSSGRRLDTIAATGVHPTTMPTSRRIIVVVLASLTMARGALAADAGVRVRRLAIVDGGANGSSVEYTAVLDPGIQKGPNGDPAVHDATLEVFYTDAPSV